MSRPALERAAELAVTRYGADRARVGQLLRAAGEAAARGTEVDLYDWLEREQLLSAAQVGELRSELDQTQMDLHKSGKNGAAAVVRAGDGDAAEGATANGAPANGATANGNDPLNDLRMLGEYHLLRRLGEGGMGAVYLGYHEKDHRQVAIKVLSTEHAKQQSTVDRFYREAKSGALLNHPNVVRNLGFGQDRATGVHYLVLEYVDGQSAQELLGRFGRLTVGDAVHITLDVARALEHAHSRNVIHRDIKPGNIWITRSGLAKLADLGLARRTDETSHLTHTRQGFGTPYYMPYEQAMNAKRADARSDIYALGATLYHLVCGEVPFPGMNPLEIIDKKQDGAFLPAKAHNAGVPDELERILADMLARNPQDRYQSISELIVDLERANLASAVPSFIDPLDAYSDPLVRQRLTAPPQATQLDVRPGATVACWYLLYRDAQGNLCKSKLTDFMMRRRVRTGRVPAQAKAARTPKGPFVPVESIAEFAGLRRVPTPKRAPRSPENADPFVRWWWMLALTLIVSLATLMMLVFLVTRQ